MTEQRPRKKIIEVHAYDETPCTRSLLDHGDAVCIHGYQLVEVWVAL